jgi:hypothetical protein
MSAETGAQSQPPSPEMRPPFESHVLHVLQLLIDGEWVTQKRLGTGTVIKCSAYEPDSFETTHCVPILPSQPRLQKVSFGSSQEAITLKDWQPKLIDISEYVVELPDFPNVKAVRQALLYREYDIDTSSPDVS